MRRIRSGRTRWRIPRRLSAVLTSSLAVATGLATLTVTAPVATGHPGLPSAVFDPNSVSWASIRDVPSGPQFDGDLATRKSQGFIPVDIDIEAFANQYRAGAVFQRNPDNRDWKVVRDLTGTQFHDEWERAIRAGMRLVDQESYLLGSLRRYAGLFIENVEHFKWSSQRDMTDGQAHDYYLEQRRTRMPIDVDSYGVGASTTPQFALIWVDNVESLDWRLHRHLTSAEFSAKFDAYYRAGFRMLAMDSMQTSAGQRYAGIWVENRNGRGWAERRDLSAQGFSNWWHRYKDEGYRLVAYDRYQTASGFRYAGIWRQNSNRPDWSLRGYVNQRVQDELDAYDVPGIAVAVIQGSELRYLRGFGHADVDGNVWMDGDHVGPFNSVSKAVAGALTMDVIDSTNGLALTDNTRDHIPGLPAFHTHDVGELTSLRGCLGHYPQIPESTFDEAPYATAQAAVQEFQNVPLVCTPGSAYRYSTPSYSVLGWVLEDHLGQSLPAIVNQRITQQYGLPRLRPIDTGDTSQRRMTLYTDGGNEWTQTDCTWKVLGGCLEGTVLDMVTFGHKVTTGAVLDDTAVDTMLTAPDGLSSYAHGWWVGTQSGHRFAWKDGNWTGSRTYLRIYPDDDVAIAVMTNRDGGGHSAIQVGQDIGAQIVAELDG